MDCTCGHSGSKHFYQDGKTPCRACQCGDFRTPADKAEADTRRRENLSKPTRDYPGDVAMHDIQMRYKW